MPIRECELSLMCNDEFGDCEHLQDALVACQRKQREGIPFCPLVAEWGEISESECLARFDDLKCWREWDTYVACFPNAAQGNRCEECAGSLALWEACQIGLSCETTEDCPQGQVCGALAYRIPQP